MDTTDLAKRMKKYEAVSKVTLMTRMPVILRIDGKAFHTYTRGFNRPFDSLLMHSMQETMKYLCENIQGCVPLRRNTFLKMVVTERIGLSTERFLFSRVKGVAM